MTSAQLWETSSRIRTIAIETITNDAPRTRSEANPIGTARTATPTAPTKRATQGLNPPSMISSAVA